ncbi:MAG: hypothetical protein ACYTG0_24620 [Planctomycetota bacterium]|jgi:hypothetical protein
MNKLVSVFAVFVLTASVCQGAEKSQLEPGFTRLDNGKDQPFVAVISCNVSGCLP